MGGEQLGLLQLGRRQGRLTFGQGLQAFLAVGLPLRELLVCRRPLGVGLRFLERSLGCGDALGRSAQPLTIGMIHQSLGRGHLAQGLLRLLRFRRSLGHCDTRLL